jgi:hypothetical protein
MPATTLDIISITKTVLIVLPHAEQITNADIR